MLSEIFYFWVCICFWPLCLLCLLCLLRLACFACCGSLALPYRPSGFALAILLRTEFTNSLRNYFSPSFFISRVIPFSAFLRTCLRLAPVPQNMPFWVPNPGKYPLRTPKQAFLVSRTRKNTPPCPKSCHFGFQNPETRPFVGQNRHFCPSVDEKQAFRWAKQAFLPIRDQKYSSPLGKTGSFAHQSAGEPFYADDLGGLRRFRAVAFQRNEEFRKEEVMFRAGAQACRRDVFHKFLCLYVRDV